MKLGKYNFKLTSPTVMGICNVTPDSFSDGETDSWDLGGQPGMSNMLKKKQVCPYKKCSLGLGETEQVEAFVNMSAK